MPRSGKAAGSSRSGGTLFRQWEALHRSHPAVLYHYTTAPGLLSMIKSGHLWATESRYMNDPREFLQGADVILGVINRIAKRKSAPRALLEIGQNVQRHIDEKLLNVRIFSVSFCTNGDLLSQWRGYGDAGGGYALGFEPRFLFGRPKAERPPLRSLLRVIYNREHQERLVAGWGRAVIAGAVSDKDPHFWRFFSEALASFKNPAALDRALQQTLTSPGFRPARSSRRRSPSVYSRTTCYATTSSKGVQDVGTRWLRH